ncbi:hypothetical protein IV102_33605 [bacterium]|nr:hypothetical protein [bacterium]
MDLLQKVALEALTESRADIAQQRMDIDFHETYERLHQLLAELSDELDVLRAALRGGQPVLESSVILKAILGEIRQVEDELSSWTDGSVPVCIRCGSKGPEEICASCHLERLYPDPNMSDSLESAHLGGDYLRLYKAYREVIEGDRPLRSLAALLLPLEATLQELMRLARHSDLEIAHEVQRGIQGLQDFRLGLATRKMRELNQGWDKVYASAVGLVRRLPGLFRQVGRPEEARRLEREQAMQDGASFSE